MSLLVHGQRYAEDIDSRLWGRSRSIDGNTALTATGSTAGPISTLSWADPGSPDNSSLRKARIESFCRRTPQLAALLGSSIRAKAISGGMTNHSYLVEGSKGRIFLKQAEACHSVETAIPLSLARLATEAIGMRLGQACAPEAVPPCLHYDGQANIVAAEFVQGREVLPAALLKGAIFPGLACSLGSALARLAAGTTREALGHKAFGALEAVAAASSSVADLMEDLVLYLPFDHAAPHNRWPAELDAEVEALVHGDAALMREVECMRRLRSGGGSPCFAHTDVWLNNILVPEWPEGGGGGSQQQEVVPTIVDFEFGAIAPTSYDIGHTLGMLVLAAFLVRAYSDGADGGAVPGARRREQEDWLLASVGEAWAEFERVWRGLQQRRSPWRQRAALPPPPLLADALGFAGCTVIRWAIGQFNIFRSLGVGDASGAAHCAAVRRAVHAGAAMLRGRHAIKSTDEVADIARAELA